MNQTSITSGTVKSFNPSKFFGKAFRTTLILLLANVFGNVAVAQTYQAVTISSGFNYDVVANGTTTDPASTITTSPYNALDGVGYTFISQDFSYGGVTPAYYLPTGGLLTSSSLPGLTYQLASYSANNALELHGNNGTLAFATPVAASKVFVLGTTGSGTSTATFTVNFSDGSTQTGTTASYPDWFTGPFEVTVGDRFNVNTNTYDLEYPNPGLYVGTITISAANCSKLISSIKVAQTGSGDLAVMAISIQLPPVISTVTGGAICGSGTVGLGASTNGGTINWYAASTGGSSLATGTSYTTPSISATTTYYLSATSGSCVTSSRTAVTATVNALPSIAAGSGVAICNGSSTALTATGGTTYTWTPSTGLSATSGASVTANPTSTTTYSVTGTTSGCSATATKVVTVNALPTIGAGSSVAICNGSSTSLTETGGTTYSWTPSTGLSATSGASVTANPSATTTYTVTGTNGTGCSNRSSVTVTVNALPSISAGSNVGICNGSSTLLTATGGTTYSWTPTTGLTATTGSSVTANPTANTTYTVTGTNGAGCSSTSSVTVTVNALPSVSVASGFVICTGTTTPAITASGAVSYTWSPSTGLSATTGSSVTANPTATTTYTVTGTNGSGCSNTATVTITVNPTPVISAAPGTAICAGSSATLSASGASSYSWSPVAGLSSVTGSSVTSSAMATIVYTVTGTNTYGCSASATEAVTVNALPVISAGAGVAICNGSSTILSVTGGITYSWTPSTGLSVTTGSSVTANPSATTTYTVTGTNGSGCSSTSSVTVTVNALPVITAGPGYTICSGNTTAVISATGGVSYTWIPSSGLSSTTGSSATASPITTTVYTVTGSNLSGCSSNATVTVSVNPAPVVSAGSGTAICNGSSAALSATGAAGYTWSPSTGLSSTTGSSVTASPLVTTVYTVTGTNSYGCQSTASVAVTVNLVPVMAVSLGVTICNGTSTVINASGAGTYSWTPATGLAASTGSSVTASPAISTIYTVTGTSVSGCSSTSTINISVNPTPSISSVGTGGVICSGNTLTLNSAAIGGTGALSYSWSGPASYSSTIQNPSITNAATTAAGVYSLTVTDVNSCTASGVTTATVNPTPSAGTITGASSVCIGNTIALSDTATGGTWSAGSGMVTAGSSTGVITGVAMGNVNITYSVTNSYSCTSKATKTVSVAGLPNYLYTGAGTGVNSSTGDGGPAYMATLKGPRALSTDTAGNVYISDVTTNTIRKISTNGYISTVAGNGTAGNGGDGGPATAAQLNMSGGGGLYIDKAGNFYISNTAGQNIRKVTASTGIISTICGTNVGGYSGDGGPASAAKVQGPLGICEDTSGNIYFADASNERIRRIDAITGIITTVIGTGSNAYSGDGGPGTSARVSVPRDVVADVYGNLYIADFGNDVIRKYVIATGIITTIAGNGTAGSGGDGGPATAAQFNSPARLAFDGSNNLYIADQANFKVRKVNLSTGIISTVIATGTAGYSGDGGPSTLGKITQAAGIAITKNGNIYVSDMSNYRVRVSPYNGSIAISLAGPSTVVAGTPVTFTANSSISGPYVTYQWLKNGSAIGTGGSTFTDYSPANGDVYKCVLAVAPTCGATFYDTSNSITISLAGYRTADTAEAVVKVAMEQSEIKLYPNPVHSQLTIEGTNLENGNIQISVNDMTGRQVSSKTAEVTDNRLTEQMDMQSLAAGMYLITLTDNAGNSKTIKCVKN